MNPDIYLLRRSPYNEDYMLHFGYAKNREEIMEIVRKYHKHIYNEEPLTIHFEERRDQVNHMLVIATDSDGFDKDTYWIEKVESVRVK